MSTESSTARGEESLPAALGEAAAARFWIRAGARIIDWAVHYATWFVASFIFAFGLALYAGMTHVAVGPLIQALSTTRWHDYVASALGLLSYHTLMEWMCGATVGKRILGLVVTNTDGLPIGFRAALGRSFAFYVDGLFFGLPAYDSMKPPLQQRLGDKWAKTLVLKRSTLPSHRVVATHSFASALCLGLLSDSVCYFITGSVRVL